MKLLDAQLSLQIHRKVGLVARELNEIVEIVQTNVLKAFCHALCILLWKFPCRQCRHQVRGRALFAGDSQQILRKECYLIIILNRLNGSQGSMFQGLSLLESHQIWIRRGESYKGKGRGECEGC